MAPVEAVSVDGVMRSWIILGLAAALPGCGNADNVAENAVPPSVNAMAETPGDWSALEGAIGRTPQDSGLFTTSPVAVDLNAMLGPSVDAFRALMADATPLNREGSVLVTRSRSGQAYLIIHPADHALEAGLRQRNLWRSVRTAGADIPRPPSVIALLGT